MVCTAKVEGVDLLPPLYQRWVDELFAGPIPAETEASCSSCAMCSESAPTGDAEHFDPRIKCCTYLPQLASFLVGRVLLDDDPAAAHGRETVRARIRGRVAVTPLGIDRPRTYTLLYREGAPPSFGRSEALRCPHYVTATGGCGVWRHRDAMCATWFCKHVRGAVGMRFWREAMHPMLAAAERALARWCMSELDVDGEVILRLLALPPEDPRAGRAIDGVIDDAGYAAVWGSWLGREEAYYAACAAKVDPLSWSDVLAIGGAELAAFAKGARALYAKLTSDALPATIHVSELHLVRSDRDAVRFRAYSPYDTIELPRAILDVLPRLEGDTQAALKALADDGVEIDPALVRQLVDFGVLGEG